MTSFENTKLQSKYIQIYPKYFQIYPNIFTYIQIHPNISKYIQIYPNISKYKQKNHFDRRNNKVTFRTYEAFSSWSKTCVIKICFHFLRIIFNFSKIIILYYNLYILNIYTYLGSYIFLQLLSFPAKKHH